MTSSVEAKSRRRRAQGFVAISALFLLIMFRIIYHQPAGDYNRTDLAPYIEKLNSAQHYKSSNPAQKQTISLTKEVGIWKGALNAIGMEGRDVRGMATGAPGSVFGMLSHLGGLGELVWVDDWTNFPVNLSSNYVPRRVAVRAAIDGIRAAGGRIIDAGHERHLVVKESEEEMYDAAIEVLGWRDGKIPPWENTDTQKRE